MGHIHPSARSTEQDQSQPQPVNQEQTALLQSLMQQVNPQLQQAYEANQEKEKEKGKAKKGEEKDESGVKLYKIHAGGEKR